MQISTSKKKKIRSAFLENPNLTIYQLAELLKMDSTTIGCALDRTDFWITASLFSENLYFLFDDFQEKKIVTNPHKEVQNAFDFNSKEKDFLKAWGFKF
jgi:hypothetical protein